MVCGIAAAISMLWLLEVIFDDQDTTINKKLQQFKLDNHDIG